MIRALSSLIVRWNAHRWFNNCPCGITMDDVMVEKWKACIPFWLEKLPTCNLEHHRSWVKTMYRHGHHMTQEPAFWQTLQRFLQRESTSNFELRAALTQAGLFNNTLPFVHLVPYDNNKGHRMDGRIWYLQISAHSGTHPAMATHPQLYQGNPADIAFFNLPARGEQTFARKANGNQENYWRFFSGEPDFGIDHIIDYYRTTLSFSPSKEVVAAWVHGAWNARNFNPALQAGSHWDTFVSAIKPKVEQLVDWNLIAACHGFIEPNTKAIHTEIARYARQMNEGFCYSHSIETTERDGATLSVLSLSEPKTAWDIYQLFVEKTPTQEMSMESYSMDFSALA